MNNENGEVLDVKPAVSAGDVVNAVDSANNALGAFAVSYFGKEHNAGVVVARGKVLFSALEKLVPLVGRVIQEYEAI